MIRSIVWPDGFIQLGIDSSSAEAFKTLVRRALNTWVDAPPELKELGDMLDHGRVLQDYVAQRSDKRVVDVFNPFTKEIQTIELGGVVIAQSFD